MKLQEIAIEGFKKFSTRTCFNFEKSMSINTISGKNGSGKTSVANALILLQQAVFLEKLLEKYPTNDFTKKAENSFNNKLRHYMTKSQMQLDVTFIENDEKIIFSLIVEEQDNKYNWRLSFLEGKEKIDKYWNLEGPNNLIMNIESDKHYEEQNINLSNISIKTRFILPVEREVWIALNMVFFPADTFYLLYKNLFDDWAYERIIPTKGKIDLYFKLAEGFMKVLFTNIKFSNFSANNFKEEEVVYLVSNQNTGGKKYDMRQLSTGEKTMVYMFMYLNLIQKISILIIDEPENHMHEELISKFLVILQTLCDPEKSYLDGLKKLGINQRLIDKTRDYVGDIETNKISQVFLVTHSKSLIYSLFDSGKNYVIDEDMQQLEYDDCEKRLREVGVSSLYDRVLFVEGITEISMFAPLTTYGIKIEKIENCRKLIETYKAIKELGGYVKGLKYLFILDADECNYDKVQDIVSSNPSDFILLDRHEIENYLLDIEIWTSVAKSLAAEEKRESITESYIRTNLVSACETQIETFRKHYMQKKIKGLIETFANTIDHRQIPLEIAEYERYIGKLLGEDQISILIANAKLIFDNCMSDFSNQRFVDDWMVIGPGKQIVNIGATQIGKDIGVTKERFISELKTISYRSSSSPLFILMEKIKERFH